jgi:2-dehydropantoate 2-reductase
MPDESSSVRIAVFGSGAVGGYFGGRLAQAGADVRFIARGSQLTAIREHGLRVGSVEGDFLIRPARVTDDPSAVGPVDVVLLGVKAWQVAQAAQAMRPLVGEQTFIVPLQNGIEAPEQLADVFGASHVLGGLCRIIAYVVTPGHIQHAGAAPYIAFGELSASSSPRAEALRQAFSRARGITAEIAPDIRAAMWSKFGIAPTPGTGPGGDLRRCRRQPYRATGRHRREDARLHRQPARRRHGFDAA